MPKRTRGRTETKPTRVTCPAEFVRFNIYKYSTVVCPHKLTKEQAFASKRKRKFLFFRDEKRRAKELNLKSLIT